MKKYSRYLVIAFSFLLAAFLIYVFRAIVSYILIAWVVSMIGQPIVVFLKSKVKMGKFRMGPNLSAGLTLLFFFIMFIAFLLLFVPLVVEQAANLADVDYAAIADALNQPFIELQARLERYGVGTEESLEDLLQKSLTGYFNPGGIANIFADALSVAGNFLIGVFSVLFISFFFLKEEGLFVRVVTSLVSKNFRPRVTHALEDISSLLSRYFAGILLQITLITIIVTVSLNLLGVNNALLIGIFAALINVIPYLGPIIGAAFGLMITVSSNLDLSFYNEMLPMLLKVMAVFATMQLLDNFIFQPFIFSTSVRAHPLEIFLVIMIGAQIQGITGMVLAIPTYTVIRVVAREFLNKFEIVQRITSRMTREVKVEATRKKETGSSGSD
jgi:predicted PurR-regulated permease PerM